ncbi:MAG: DUF1015 domain-containing protein [Lachnospiraceae bacterium]|nr:DUF1015 domain-containing protein [Lachnospiraceae bacterium]
MDREFEGLGFAPADILLPQCGDMSKWAVVACDQFTSQPEYWEETDRIVGDSPSARKLILPESDLKAPDVDDRIRLINETMETYVSEGLFRTLRDSLVYVERTISDGRVRKGLVGMFDLETYDFTPGSGALMRATEGTVLERIPPRLKVRKDALIELPHIMVLIDDPDNTVIGPCAAEKPLMEVLYDFDLMQGGGHVSGWNLTAAQKSRTAAALKALTSPEVQEAKYGLKGAAPLLYAVGDGNHSLATAKQAYENLKKVTPQSEWANLPARFCLAELVNNHDDGLSFEPIHRVVFDVNPSALLDALKGFYPGAYEGSGEGHVLHYVYAGGEGCVTAPDPRVQLCVGTLQNFLDDYLKKCGGSVDYIHGEETVRRLSEGQNRVGFLLPPMAREDLFRTVMADGVLPRKTFSMGNAEDKRYYLEARSIRL